MPGAHLLRRAAAGALCLCCLASCIRNKLEETPVAEKQTTEQIMASVGNPLLANRGDINAVNVTVRTSEELEQIDNGSDEELIWTNPDDPDAEIPGLTQAFQNKMSGNAWQIDFARAVQLARRNELPLLVWFHDSVISPTSKALAGAYLETKEFDDWSRGRIIRAKLDSGASLDDSTAQNAKYSYHRINALQKRYGLKKKPSIAIITPTGKIVARIDGFDGFLNGFIREVREGVALAEKEYKQYKSKYEEMGYRTWRARKGEASVFAKVMRLDEEKNLVFLKEPGGRVTRTKVSSFAPADEKYLRSLYTKPPADTGKAAPPAGENSSSFYP
ncbi:MAG: hypothetical protein J1E42_06170 [Akkermansiaceae bacterium]|nr:hypothetical protein [Akkermansiaceae bacterium]